MGEKMTEDNERGQQGGCGDGRLLRDALRYQMCRNICSMSDAAIACGVGYKYFSALMAGDRPFSHLKHEKYRLIALFLKTSVVQVMVWADAISLEDFHAEEDRGLLLEASYIKMRHDQNWGVLLPRREVWDQADPSMKIALVRMYEALAGRALLDKVKAGPLEDDEGGGDSLVPMKKPA